MTRLTLEKTDKEGLKIGTKSNGKAYSVRDDRSRYFFPEEWNRFINTVSPSKRMLYEFLLHTGARIEEALNVKVRDINPDRNTITLRVTKRVGNVRLKKEKVGKPRSFEVGADFMKKLKKYVKDNKFEQEDILFDVSKQAAWQTLRRNLKKAGFADWYNFSLHNIRKTHGMWLRALIPYARGLDMGEICLRLGHDAATYLKHYGSPSIFNEKEKNMMINILGGIYNLH